MPSSENSRTMSFAMSEPVHGVEFNPNPKTITWERLENLRLRKLGLGSERYSRHFQRFHNPELPGKMYSSTDQLHRQNTHYILSQKDFNKSNSVAPFGTLGKPTCGFFFSRTTDNKKRKIGIPPTNLVKWRSFVQ